MVPESLCPKVDYAVSLLEYIDIDTPQFLVPQEKIEDVMLSHAKYNQKCMVRVSMPRFGFTRGISKNRFVCCHGDKIDLLNILKAILCPLKSLWITLHHSHARMALLCNS
jgi:hypothetical protein